MGSYNFHKDLAKAKNTQELAKVIIENNSEAWLGEYSGFFFKDINDKTGDLHLIMVPSGDEYLIEIKEDFYCRKSGNVAVEYECRGKPSGVSSTKATHWLYRIHQPSGEDVWIFMPTAIVRGGIQNKEFLREVVGGDYGSNTRMYLFSLDKFRSFGIELTNKSETPIIFEEE